MSNDRTQTAVLGLFVTVAGGISLAALTAVSSVSSFLDSRTSVHADFEKVQGLQPGDAIWFSGVPVGQVREVVLAPEGRVRVGLAIDTSQATHIPSDTKAKISSDGIIGNAIVVLAPGSAGARPIEDGDELEVIASLSTDELMAGIDTTNRKLQEVVTNLSQATRPLAEGEGSVGRFLREDALYEEVEATVGDLRVAAASAQSGSASFARFGRRLSDPDALPHQLVTDTEVFPMLREGVSSVKGAADELSVAASDVKSATQSTDTPLGVLMHDRSAGGDLEATLDHLNTSSVLLSQNLESMQRSFLLKPLFPSKKKQEARAAEALAEAQRKADEAQAAALADADGE